MGLNLRVKQMIVHSFNHDQHPSCEAAQLASRGACGQGFGSRFYFDQIRTQGSVTRSNEGIFSKFYGVNILDNFICLLFCSHTFGIRRLVDVLDPENQPGSGTRAIGLIEDVCHQKYEHKKRRLLK